MAVSDSHLDYLRDLLAWLPQLRIKRMFGGAGLYSDDLFFAIADEDGLYLKADDESMDLYSQGGGEQYTYESKGKVARMNFWSVPIDIMEDSDQLANWVAAALDTALRAR